MENINFNASMSNELIGAEASVFPQQSAIEPFPFNTNGSNQLVVVDSGISFSGD